MRATAQPAPEPVENFVEFENRFRDFFWQAPIGRFWEALPLAFKSMNSNQLCNSSDSNIAPN